jgi:hypothetical protein
METAKVKDREAVVYSALQLQEADLLSPLT